jgi:hypothetical protein
MPAFQLPPFLVAGAPLIGALGLVLSWLCAQVVLSRVALPATLRRGVHLGLGAANGMGLVALLALALRGG